MKKLFICLLAVMASGAYTKTQTVKVPKVAIIWTYSENERGTNEGGVTTATVLLRKLFEERAGYEVVSDALVRSAWKQANLADRPSTVEDPSDMPTLPEPKELLAFGKLAGVDFVCVGTTKWRVRSIWVGLGPKTKADATVSVRIIDVKKAEVALEALNVSSDSTKAEKWYESAGALLVAWGITLFSGGPKTPHIQRSGVKAIGAATEEFFTVSKKKIG